MLFLGGNKYRTLALYVGEVFKNRDNKICSEKDYAGDAQQKKLKSTDPTSRQTGRPTSTNT
jgi:hypothetical protein